MSRSLLIIVLLVASLAAFLPGVAGPFMLDDEMNLMRARATSGELSDYVDAVIRNGTGLLRRPVSNASFLANYHLFGYAPLPYKLVNLGIHAINGLLVWLLARRLLRALAPQAHGGVAPAVALAWMLHPLQVSTVLYAVQRMTQLSALFTFAFVWYGLRMIERLRDPVPGSSPEQPYVSAAVALGLLAMALLSKENGALAPLLLLSAVACMPPAGMHGWSGQRPTAIFLGIVIALPLVTGALAAPLALPGVLAGYQVRDFSMLERLLTQPLVLAHYLSTIVVPDVRDMGLYLDFFPLQHANEPWAWLGLGAIAGILVFAWLLRRRAPVLAFAVLWFFAAHAMESTILPLEMAFEHRNHVAMLGPLLGLFHYAALAGGRILVPRQLAMLAALPLLLLAGLTLHRAHTWSNMALFTQHEARNHPDSSRANTQAAAMDVARGDLAGAVARIRRGQRLRPNSFWTKAYDIHLACAGADVSIDWDDLLEQARRRPDEMGIEEALRSPVRLIALQQCPAVDNAQFDLFLKRLLDSMSMHPRKNVIERLHILRAQLAAARGDSAAEGAYLAHALEANPEGLDALMRLAYRSLNQGDVDAADRFARELEQRIGSFHRTTLYFKVAELRNFIEQERQEQQRSGV